MSSESVIAQHLYYLVWPCSPIHGSQKQILMIVAKDRYNRYTLRVQFHWSFVFRGLSIMVFWLGIIDLNVQSSRALWFNRPILIGCVGISLSWSLVEIAKSSATLFRPKNTRLEYSRISMWLVHIRTTSVQITSPWEHSDEGTGY